MRFVADTSWLMARMDGADPAHEKAAGQGGLPGTYIIPSEILQETLGVWMRRAKGLGLAGPAAGRRLVEAFQEDGFTFMGTPHVAPVLALHQAHHGLSYADCVAIWHARDADLLTFDARQRRAWRLLRRAPPA